MNATYQVQSNRTVRGPSGRFIARGVQMFPYLFVSNESSRANWNFRQVYSPEGKGAAYGISEPTYYGRVQYISHANVEKQLSLAYGCGINLIRVDVEPAVFYATVPYIDPMDGLTYPSDLTMLDDIIDTAASFGIVVQIQNANDLVPTSVNVEFLRKLTARYWNRPNIWINPMNEPNGTNADVNNVTLWADEIKQYMVALREDVAGQPAGTKYKNPICLDAPGWADRWDLTYPIMTTDPVFTGEDNMILQVHIYPGVKADGTPESSFTVDRFATAAQHWWQFRTSWALMLGEVGIDNFDGRFDANLDPGIPSANTATWAKMQSFSSDLLTWCDARTKDTPLSGAIGHMWYAYIPGLSVHDDNSMRRQDGSWTAWGLLYRDKYLSPAYALV